MIALDKPTQSLLLANGSSIPQSLIYEIIDGVPFYRKGYKDVLDHKKTIEEIMGCSSYQWKIIEYLLELLFTMPGRSRYRIATNEPGLHLDKNNNLAGDILLFDKDDVKGVSVKYTDVAPVVHIEVDISVQIEDGLDIEYIENKVNKLLQFGTKKIIWVFTRSNKILLVEKQNEWHWHSIQDKIVLVDDVVFCISDFLLTEGINQ